MAVGWDAAELAVASDSARTARYRRLQSWYRETVLGARPGTYRPRGHDERPLGSLLHPDDVAARPGLNFLDDRIHSYACERAKAVQREGGTLEEHRVFHNMLSSMPLCFNVFGMVRETPEGKLPFVRALFDLAAVEVELIECEWTPVPATINDRTAFDAAIITRRADGTRHLIAVETKYTEPFSRTRYGARSNVRGDVGKYDSDHERCGWFRSGTTRNLTGSATNQLWRNCLLAAVAEADGVVDSAEVVVVALADDLGAAMAIAGVQAVLSDPARCRFVPLELIAHTASFTPGLEAWASDFDERYVLVGRRESEPART